MKFDGIPANAKLQHFLTMLAKKSGQWARKTEPTTTFKTGQIL